MSTQRVRVWVAGLTIGGAVNKAQNSTVSAFLYAVSGTSDLLVVPSQYFYLRKKEACCQTSFNDPDGVRTHDLRRDRAAL